MIKKNVSVELASFGTAYRKTTEMGAGRDGGGEWGGGDLNQFYWRYQVIFLQKYFHIPIHVKI